MSAEPSPERALAGLYQELILEHYRNPRNRGELANATATVELYNPTCGDEVRLQLCVEDDRVTAVGFTGVGCSISQAATSMLTQLVAGKPIAEVHTLGQRFTAMLHGDELAARDRTLGDLRALAGVSRFPVRVRCALLGWDALARAMHQGGAG